MHEREFAESVAVTMEAQIQKVWAWQHVSEHEEPILQMGTDKMIRFPDRSVWKGRFQPDKSESGFVQKCFQDKQRHLGWGVWIWYQEEG
jgi:hypothetical protein